MSRDLDEQLDEMGPEYREVVARLRAGREAEFGQRTTDSRQRSLSFVLCPLSWLVAASLLVILGLSAIFCHSNIRTFEHSNNSPFGPSEYRASVAEMIVTQNPDGSWKNDFLTRRNAAALKVCGDPAAQIAYKKAVRNLRLRGIL